MFTIHLDKLHFFAYHGLFEEERVLGSNYEVNLSLTLDKRDKVSSLEQSIDYVSLYKMVKDRMAIPIPLLETLAADMAEQIHQNFRHAKSVKISIYKENPPIEQMQGTVGISYTKEF